MKIAQTLISGAPVKHADLGLNANSVSADTTEGANVVNLRDGGPAQKAGILEGDTIIKVGDRVVRSEAELTVAVREHGIGETVPVQLVRAGHPLVVDVTLGSD
jgi:S1-C subfamily serine protease